MAGWLKSIGMVKEEEEKSKRKTKRGFMAVYVGEEKARFMVRTTTLLSEPLFKELLDKAAEEFRFKCEGGLVLPCSVSTFRDILEGRQEKKIKSGFVAMYAGEYMERFTVPIGFLTHPLFKVLLDYEAADEFEFGFKRTTFTGRLVVPCTASVFRQLIRVVQQEQGFSFIKALVSSRV